MLYKVSVSFHKNYIEVKDNEIEVGVMAKPLKGEANIEVIDKIAKHFNVKKTNVRIVSGIKSRKKIAEIFTVDNQTKPKK